MQNLLPPQSRVERVSGSALSRAFPSSSCGSREVALKPLPAFEIESFVPGIVQGNALHPASVCGTLSSNLFAAMPRTRPPVDKLCRDRRASKESVEEADRVLEGIGEADEEKVFPYATFGLGQQRSVQRQRRSARHTEHHLRLWQPRNPSTCRHASTGMAW